ncbi:hypothetical protein AB0C18_33770 [Nonomuraea muscovyensis]|uniref:hypothetical protein n=1 Tax=Nonomuraea muscovyensis TaxID=1124761 RepID=UPI0033D53231
MLAEPVRVTRAATRLDEGSAERCGAWAAYPARAASFEGGGRFDAQFVGCGHDRVGGVGVLGEVAGGGRHELGGGVGRQAEVVGDGAHGEGDRAAAGLGVGQLVHAVVAGTYLQAG